MAKSHSRRRRPEYLLVAVLVVASAVVLVSLLIRRDEAPRLQAGGRTYVLEVAKTIQQHEKGLGDRAAMSDDRGMLFAYDTDGQYCFWMKGMQFSLDIIWLDASKNVVKLAQNLSPATYPNSYCPDKANTRYVIELNTGQARAARIQTGDRLHF